MDAGRWLAGGGAISLAALATSTIWKVARNRSVKRDLQLVRFRHLVLGWLRDGIATVLGAKFRRAWLSRTKVQKYVDVLLDQHLSMVIPGHSALPLKQCYVPMDLRAGHVNSDTHLAAKVGTVLLVGGTGSGKSAFLSRLLHHLCWEFTHHQDASRLPVHGTLQQLQRFIPEEWNQVPQPEEALGALERWFEAEVSGPLGAYDSRGMISSYSSSPSSGVVVLLDGLDELSPEMLRKTEYFLQGLKQALIAAQGKNLLLVASRDQAIDFVPDFVRVGASVTTVNLEPFSDAAIYAFISKWLRFKRASRDSGRAPGIFAALKANSSLLEACRSPLVLALYMERFYGAEPSDNQAGILAATTRAGFFREVLQHLVVERRATHTNRPVPNRALSVQRLQFFVEVAKDHIDSTDPYNQVREAHLLSRAPGVPKGATLEEKRAALGVVANETGILSRGDDAVWRFTHPAFLDYFVACALIQQTGNEASFRSLMDDVRRASPRLTEAFYFTFGLMANNSAIQLDMCMQILANNARMGEHYPRVCQETQHFNSPGFVQNLKVRCREWRDANSDSLFVADQGRLRLLAQVLYSREILFHEMSMAPGISVLSEFGDLLERGQLSVFDLSGLEIAIAKHLAGGSGALGIVQDADSEDALIALFDEEVVRELLRDREHLTPATARLIAEAALRSDLIAKVLAPRTIPPWRPAYLTARRERSWPEAWPVRDSDYGWVLSMALGQARLEAATALSLPRLALLEDTKPISRFSFETFLGRPARSIAFLGLFSLVFGLLLVVGSGTLVAFITAAATVFAAFLVVRKMVLWGKVSLDSTRILNRLPYRPGPIEVHQPYVRLVRGTPDELSRIARSLPRFSEGPISAVYFRIVPFVWIRYSPNMGDHHLTLRRAAMLSSMWTEEVRRLREMR